VALAKLARGAAQRVVAQRLVVGLERVDALDGRAQPLDVAVVRRAEDLLQEGGNLSLQAFLAQSTPCLRRF